MCVAMNCKMRVMHPPGLSDHWLIHRYPLLVKYSTSRARYVPGTMSPFGTDSRTRSPAAIRPSKKCWFKAHGSCPRATKLWPLCCFCG